MMIRSLDLRWSLHGCQPRRYGLLPNFQREILHGMRQPIRQALAPFVQLRQAPPERDALDSAVAADANFQQSTVASPREVLGPIGRSAIRRVSTILGARRAVLPRRTEDCEHLVFGHADFN